MKKTILISIVGLLIAIGAFVFINSKENYDPSKYYLKYDKDKKVLEFALPDQFNKTHTIKDDTKIVLFAFKKEDGHTIREYLKKNRPSMLDENHAIFVADISKVPSFIRNLVILKDFKKSKFPVVIIYDKNISAKINDNQNKILVFHLKNKKITKVEHIKTTDDLKRLLK